MLNVFANALCHTTLHGGMNSDKTRTQDKEHEEKKGTKANNEDMQCTHKDKRMLGKRLVSYKFIINLICLQTSAKLNNYTLFE